MSKIPEPKPTPPLATLHFDADGIGGGLYTEVIDLRAIGKLEVNRASQVEFNPVTQQWEVFDYTGYLVFSHSSRSYCLSWELAYFNGGELPDGSGQPQNSAWEEGSRA